MTSRAPLTVASLVSSASSAASVVLVAWAVACSGPAFDAVATTPSGDGAGGGSVLSTPDAGAPDAAEDVGVEAMAPVAVYQGNPLCNASPATSCCYPDALNLCAPTACVPPADAGSNDGATGIASQVAYGCHLAPAPATPGIGGDATSAAAVQQVAPACMPAGLGLDGALCHDGDDCAPGYECVGDPGASNVCRHYCCAGNSACLVDQFCDIQHTAGGATMNVPVCMPVRQCDLLPPLSCPATETCAVVREDGSKSCVALGSAMTGQSCETEHCAAGLMCLGATARTCYALCQVNLPGQCPSTQACKGGPPLFLDPGVGVCQ